MEKKRKRTITTMEKEGVILREPKEIQDHIYKYYKALFGSEERKGICMNFDAWGQEDRLPDEDNEEMTKQFSE